MDMNMPKKIPDRREVNSYFIEQDQKRLGADQLRLVNKNNELKYNYF